MGVHSRAPGNSGVGELRTVTAAGRGGPGRRDLDRIYGVNRL